jgi:hypothetical protein
MIDGQQADVKPSCIAEYNLWKNIFIDLDDLILLYMIF